MPPLADTQSVLQKIAELNPINALLCDETVNDILINGAREVYVERGSRLYKTDIVFGDEKTVRKLAESIVKAVGRTLDPERPLVDARLEDGSRVNIVSPPLSIDGTTISIRKFSRKKLTLDRMIENGNLSESLGEFLKVVGRCRMNIVIAGGTGSGKTTLLNAISQYIEEGERVVTIEDAAELQLSQPHVVRLETKPRKPAEEAGAEVTTRDLVRNALRMRPDRIIVGEVRGAEAFDMMQAMNSGHEGSMTTVHANHPRDVLYRLENMLNMANLNIPAKSLRTQIASALHLVIQVSRMRDGIRRVTHVSEIVGMEGDVMTMQDLFQYKVFGEDPEGRIMGNFEWTGIMPRFVRRVAYYGELNHLAKALNVKIPKI